MKKTLLLFVAAILGSLALVAQTSGYCGTTENGADGTNLTWSYDAATTTLTISGTGEMQNFVWGKYGPSSPWYNSYATSITKVVISEGVTSIGDEAFDMCSEITSVTIPSTVTYIGMSAFRNCLKLNAAYIPDAVTHIGMEAFRNCTALIYVDMSKGIKYIGDYAFYKCSFPYVSTPASLEYVGGEAFTGTPYIGNRKEVDVYLGKTYYKYKGTMPENTSVTIKEGTKYIAGGAFTDLSALTSVNIPSSVSFIGSRAFYNCSGLKDIWCYATVPPETDVEVFDFIPSDVKIHVLSASLTDYKKANEWEKLSNYQYIEGYYTISLKPNVSSWGTVTGQGAYKSGTTVVISATPAEGCTFVKWSDGNTKNPREISVNKDIQITAEFTLSKSLTVNVTTPGKLDTEINNKGGNYNTLKNLTITGELNEKDLQLIKNNMPALQSLNIKGITNTTLPDNWLEKNKTIITVILPDGLSKISNSCFNECSNLNSVTIPDGVTTIGNSAFSKCTALNTVTIPSSITSVGDHAFSDCTALAVVYISDLTAWCNIQFNNSEGTSNPLHRGGSLNINNERIDSLVIPNGITELKNNVFCGGSFTTVNIPSSVTEISPTAFGYGDPSVTNYIPSPISDIYCFSIVPPALLGIEGINTKKATLHVPSQSISDYKLHSMWSKFTKITSIISGYKVTINSSDATMGSVSGSGYYEHGTSVEISATANKGYEFTGWSDGNKENPRTIIIEKDITLTAQFAIEEIEIKVVSENKTQGTVTGGGKYQPDTKVKIEAIANEGYEFTQWTDGNTENPRTITVTGPAEYTAQFDLIKYNYNITTSSAMPEKGTVETTIILKAKPIEGFKFSHWSDGNTENPRTLTAEGNIELYAYFEKEDTHVKIDDSRISAANVYTTSGTLHVEGAEQLTTDYHVLDAAGRLIYSGRRESIQLPNGIYLVTIDGEIQKIAL